LVEASVFPLPQVLATEGGEVEQLQLAQVVGGSGPAPIISAPAVDLEEMAGEALLPVSHMNTSLMLVMGRLDLCKSECVN